MTAFYVEDWRLAEWEMNQEGVATWKYMASLTGRYHRLEARHTANSDGDGRIWQAGAIDAWSIAASHLHARFQQ